MFFFIYFIYKYINTYVRTHVHTYNTVHYRTVHYSTLQYSTLPLNLPCITLHYVTYLNNHTLSWSFIHYILLIHTCMMSPVEKHAHTLGIGRMTVTSKARNLHRKLDHTNMWDHLSAIILAAYKSPICHLATTAKGSDFGTRCSGPIIASWN